MNFLFVILILFVTVTGVFGAPCEMEDFETKNCKPDWAFSSSFFDLCTKALVNNCLYDMKPIHLIVRPLVAEARVEARATIKNI